MRPAGGALPFLALIGLIAACTGATPSAPSASLGSPSPSGAGSTPSADWPPFATRVDSPAGVTLGVSGETATLSNHGTTGFWWPLRIDARSGPPWRNVRPGEGQEFLNALAAGDTYTWTFDPRTGPIRVGIRLWPDQKGSGLPWLMWADLPGGTVPGPSANEYPWVLGISNGTTMPVSLVVNGTTIRTVPPSQGLGDGIPRSQLAPLPWVVEARSPAGNVLVSMTVHDGDIWQSTSANGGSGLANPGARVNLACGRIDIYVGAGMSGPGPPPSSPPCPP